MWSEDPEASSGAIAGGSRAVEHLAHIGIEAEMVPLRNNLLFPRVGNAFNEPTISCGGVTR
jgi:hypothetical protein